MAKTAAKKKTSRARKCNFVARRRTPARRRRSPPGGEKLVQCLEREGVEIIFGLPGGAAIPLFRRAHRVEDQAGPGSPRAGATHWPTATHAPPGSQAWCW